jgi:leucyl-tRNA synthetase
LFDLGIVSTNEPYQKLFNQGMILAYAYETQTGAKVPSDMVEEKEGKYIHRETGEELNQIVAKMSKSLKNVVNPDDVVSQYGADSLRLYEMFMGPLDAVKPWAENGVKGVFNFLTRASKFFGNKDNYFEGEEDIEVLKLLHKTIEKVSNDIENLRFNTAISQMMIFTNLCLKKFKVTKITGETFAKVLSPFAPHLAEEIWAMHGNKQTLAFETFPVTNQQYLVENTAILAVSFNGKRRFEIEVPLDIEENSLKKLILEDERSKKWLDSKQPKKIIIVPGKIVNIVV